MWNFNNTYQTLPKLFYTPQNPTAVPRPQAVILNKPLAESLRLAESDLQAEVLGGNQLPVGAQPLAQAYAGHQFGHFTMLGDGRAILLGEHFSPSEKPFISDKTDKFTRGFSVPTGEKYEKYDIQLKGAGPTVYSRNGDGRAALAPMLREYIISEAMHALEIPTTRSLAVVSTGEQIIREKPLQGAVLTRVAASHIRVGTFEFAAAFGEPSDVRSLADYTINRHFPAIIDTENKYILLLREVVQRQAALIAKWQSAGFIHGVMNTDNMSICGETIDYGPCAFMDVYSPDTVFSSIDKNGRYAYGNQPKIALWNLARFAESLLSILHKESHKATEIAQAEIEKFDRLFRNERLKNMRGKLGIFSDNPEEEDEFLIDELLQLMQDTAADYTNTFRALTLDLRHTEFLQWNEKWQNRLHRQGKTSGQVQALMKSRNPAVIPRNHRVEAALQAAENGDFAVLQKLLQILAAPYEYNQEQEQYAQPPDPGVCYKTYCGT
ncbi:MAG: YdiU family protein [Oscillospiraceae bacterium]|nr:YdiU family protein [Oscillospiraceae bacterium]